MCMGFWGLAAMSRIDGIDLLIFVIPRKQYLPKVYLFGVSRERMPPRYYWRGISDVCDLP